MRSSIGTSKPQRTACTPVMGYNPRDLTTGESISDSAGITFPTASSLKLAVLVTPLRQAQEGKIGLAQEITIHRNQTVAGSGILYMLEDGAVHLSWRDVGKVTVFLGDNSTINILIDRLRIDDINGESRRLGLAHTLLQPHMMDLKATQVGHEDVSTPEKLSQLLEKVYDGQALDSAKTKDCLMKQIDSERKIACDDFVVSRTGSAGPA